MIEARGGTSIKASAARVFDVVADARNEPNWLPGASDVALTAEAVGPGATFSGTYARAGRVDLRVVAYDRPNRVTIHGEGKGMSFEDEIVLRESDGVTTLEAVMRTEPKGVFRLFAPMMGRVIQRQFASNWDNLRDAIESGRV